MGQPNGATKLSARCFILHGMNDWSSGRDNVDKLAPYLARAGYRCINFDYGWRGLIGVRFGNGKLAQRLANLVQQGDSVVAYSNGADVAFRAADLGAPLKHITLIAPALDCDAAVANHVRTVNVWHSPSELPTRLGALLPFHRFGAMGAYGYRGDDPRFKNYNKERDFAERSSRSHGDVFRPPLLGFFGPKIVEAMARPGLSGH